MAKLTFKTRAAKHQQQFREEVLNLPNFEEFPYILTDEDALKGYNFHRDFPGFMEAVTKRYKGFRKPMYKNMLRSEHLPFNLFVPLQIHLHDERVLKFFRELFPTLDIQKLEAIEIEKSPEKKRYAPSGLNAPSLFEDDRYLDDNTSFDALVTYQSTTGREAIGIEVKYTEKSYPYSEEERNRMFCEGQDSLYHKRHDASGIYKPDRIWILRMAKFKQFWRNHLLGLAMVQKGDIKNFTSVHLYPDGNNYQANAALEYKAMLRQECKDTFIPLTLEMFIVIGLEVFYGEPEWEQWVRYLGRRYVM